VAIGIKLAAFPLGAPEEADMADAIGSAMKDIARLTGTDFAGKASDVLDEEASV